MKPFVCPHCGQSAFATLCTDCQAEGIRIHATRSIFHVGRCHRCGHVDDEPCGARVGRGEVFDRALLKLGGSAQRFTAWVAGTFGPRTPPAPE